jgi:hypothetical protein
MPATPEGAPQGHEHPHEGTPIAEKPHLSDQELGATLETIHEGRIDVDWSKIIERARTIDIVVHYYERWARELEEEFGRFFGRGGKLRLIMADPTIPDNLATVHHHFFPNLKIDQLKTRILDTERVFREIFAGSAGPHAMLDVRYFPSALHYSFVLIDSRDLYLSVYEQFRGRVIRSSVFHLDLRRDSGMEEYWSENLELFVKGSRGYLH